MSRILALVALVVAGVTGCASGHCRSQYSDPDHVRAPSDPAKISSSFLPTVESGAENSTINIYKPDGSLYCVDQQGMSPDAMEKELKGIKVYSRRKGSDGMMHKAECNSPTDRVNIYEINITDWTRAEQRGFRKLRNL